MDQSNDSKVCKCPHHKVRGVAMALVALDVLLANLGTWSWQTALTIAMVIVIIAAIAKMFGGNCTCCNK